MGKFDTCPDLSENFLMELGPSYWKKYTPAMLDRCKAENLEARRSNCKAVVGYPRSENIIYMSVYGSDIHTRARFGRYIVWYTSKDDLIQCVCCSKSSTCTHKCLAHWYLLQQGLYVSPEVLDESLENVDDVSNDFHETVEPTSVEHTNSDEDKTVVSMTEYLLMHKKYDPDCSVEVVDIDNIPKDIIPPETCCINCRVSLGPKILVEKMGNTSTEEIDLNTNNITEERLLKLIESSDKESLKNMAREANISCSGSKMDIINRFKTNVPLFNKIFSKIPGKSGGWVTFACPHGIVYYLNSLRRAESVRDYVDGYLSMLHPPTVTIFDSAHLLSIHGNGETRREDVIKSGHGNDDGKLFFPYEGRIADAQDLANVQNALGGNMQVHLPCLGNVTPVCQRGGNNHPITGIAFRFALLDRFHENNTTVEIECLRKIKLVPELFGKVNTNIAEQTFAKHNDSKNFLNHMRPVFHYYLLRSIVNESNHEINENEMKRLTKETNSPVVISDNNGLFNILFGHSMEITSGKGISQPSVRPTMNNNSTIDNIDGLGANPTVDIANVSIQPPNFEVGNSIPCTPSHNADSNLELSDEYADVEDEEDQSSTSANSPRLDRTPSHEDVDCKPLTDNMVNIGLQIIKDSNESRYDGLADVKMRNSFSDILFNANSGGRFVQILKLAESHFVTVSNVCISDSDGDIGRDTCDSNPVQICIYDAYIRNSRREEENNEYRYSHFVYRDCAELLDTKDKDHMIVKVMVVPQAEEFHDNGIYCLFYAHMLVEGSNPNHLPTKNHKQLTDKVFPKLTQEHFRNFLQNGSWFSDHDEYAHIQSLLGNVKYPEKLYTEIKLPLYCICREPRYGGIEMVLCDGDGCENEFHSWCINYDPACDKQNDFYCSTCSLKQSLASSPPKTIKLHIRRNIAYQSDGSTEDTPCLWSIHGSGSTDPQNDSNPDKAQVLALSPRIVSPTEESFEANSRGNISDRIDFTINSTDQKYVATVEPEVLGTTKPATLTKPTLSAQSCKVGRNLEKPSVKTCPAPSISYVPAISTKSQQESKLLSPPLSLVGKKTEVVYYTGVTQHHYCFFPQEVLGMIFSLYLVSMGGSIRTLGSVCREWRAVAESMRNAKLFNAMEEIRENIKERNYVNGVQVYDKLLKPMLEALQYLVSNDFGRNIEPPLLIFKSEKYAQFVLSLLESEVDYSDVYEYLGLSFVFPKITEYEKAYLMLEGIGVQFSHNKSFCTCCSKATFKCGTCIDICDHMCKHCGSVILENRYNNPCASSSTPSLSCRRCINIQDIKGLLRTMFVDDPDFGEPGFCTLCEKRHIGKFKFNPHFASDYTSLSDVAKVIQRFDDGRPGTDRLCNYHVKQIKVWLHKISVADVDPVMKSMNKYLREILRKERKNYRYQEFLACDEVPEYPASGHFTTEVVEHVSEYISRAYLTFDSIEKVGFNLKSHSKGVNLVHKVLIPTMFDWLVMYYTCLDAKQCRYFVQEVELDVEIKSKSKIVKCDSKVRALTSKPSVNPGRCSYKKGKKSRSASSKRCHTG